MFNVSHVLYVSKRFIQSDLHSMETTDFKHILHAKFVVLTVSLAHFRKGNLHTRARFIFFYNIANVLCLCATSINNINMQVV